MHLIPLHSTPTRYTRPLRPGRFAGGDPAASLLEKTRQLEQLGKKQGWLSSLVNLGKALLGLNPDARTYDVIAQTQPVLLKLKGQTVDPQLVADVTALLAYLPAHLKAAVAKRQGIVLCNYLSEVVQQNTLPETLEYELTTRAVYIPERQKLFIPSGKTVNPALLAAIDKQLPHLSRTRELQGKPLKRLPLARCLPHEFAHALDRTLHNLSASPMFQTLYDADLRQCSRADRRMLKTLRMAEKKRWLGLRKPWVPRTEALSETFAEVGACVMIVNTLAPNMPLPAEALEHAGNLLARSPHVRQFWEQQLLNPIAFQSVVAIMEEHGSQPKP